MPAKPDVSPDLEKVFRRAFKDVPKTTNGKKRPRGSFRRAVEAIQTAGYDLHEDTIRKIAVSLDLIESRGDKYQPSAERPQVWTRPCMNCGDTKPRPRNLYMCDKCRSRI